ncbi:EAL domain-containing protein [Alicyclobacillus ferrooxydans]|uniref:EAL domain-containing protein n=1 Tax=Alicyclobacillus ferrooxydans TaxID=471514 RepID=A0A0P9GTC2_9BACL|nr:EAL domain-containing protein [Alicyclobacillus ferrooxydans]KPV44410.1 hypothetical protein AN477_07225 [Alicyclobacillus ferrooxydans]
MDTRYQPICDTWNTNQIIGYEATTDGFLDLIRRYGSREVNTIDYLARCQALDGLMSRLNPNQRIFVNLFPDHEVGEYPWFDEDHDLNHVTLEITEHQLLPTNDKVLGKIEANRRRGMKVALDDFGVGADALKLVDILHPEYIKLDKYFVETMRQNGQSTSIRGMLRFCEEGAINLIVEGVESKQDYHQLLELGVRYMQGWYLGMPKPLSELFS